MRFFWMILCVGGLAGPVQAQKLWDKVKKGAEATGEAIGSGAEAVGGAVVSGAEAVGDVVSDGATAVGDAIDSTSELVSNEETPEQTRARLDAMADSILARLLAENAEAAALYEVSAGYAAFDSRQVTVFPFSAGYGRGVAIAPEDGARTYMNMGTGGVGAAVGIGGFATQFVILFENAAAFQSFITDGYDATAGAGTMSGTDSTDETARFVEGRSFFALSKKGWRVNANATGTKYWKSPELN